MIFRKLRESLRKTREKLPRGLGKLFGVSRELDDAFMAELEEVLYGADLGPTGLAILKALRAEYKERELKTTDGVRVRLREMLRERLGGPGASERAAHAVRAFLSVITQRQAALA